MIRSPNSWACIARFGGLGDNLIATSVFPGLKRRYGHLEVIGSKLYGAMYENNPYIDKLSIREDGDPAWGDGHSWQQWFSSRAKEYAFFANLSHSCEATGVFLRVQTPFWWPVEMRRKLASRSYLELVADICNIPYSESEVGFFPTDEEKAQVEDTKKKLGGEFIGWMMSGSRLDKVHPEADVVVARLIRETGLPVVLFGGPGRDFEFAQAIETEVKRRNRSSAGLHLALSPDPKTPSWPPRRICSMLQAAKVVVGPDTGPMWAVSSHSMPKIVLASHAGMNVTKHWKNTVTLHADPTRVPCWPCHRLHDDYTTCVPNESRSGAACMSDITVEDIVSKVHEALKGLTNGCNFSVCRESDVGLGTRGSEPHPADDESGRVVARIANLNKW